MVTLPGEAILYHFHFCLFSQKGPTPELFSLRVYPVWEDYIVQGSKQEVTEIVLYLQKCRKTKVYPYTSMKLQVSQSYV